MKQPKMTAQDKKWQAQSDARTLAESEVIEATPSRLRPARQAAKEMAAEAQKQANGMKEVAGLKRKRSPAGKPKRSSAKRRGR